MEEKAVDFVKDKETQDLFRHIFDKSMGTVIELDAVPTATAPLLEPNQWGFYSGVLYHRSENIIYVITPSSTITVTV